MSGPSAVAEKVLFQSSVASIQQLAHQFLVTCLKNITTATQEQWSSYVLCLTLATPDVLEVVLVPGKTHTWEMLLPIPKQLKIWLMPISVFIYHLVLFTVACKISIVSLCLVPGLSSGAHSVGCLVTRAVLLHYLDLHVKRCAPNTLSWTFCCL